MATLTLLGFSVLLPGVLIAATPAETLLFDPVDEARNRTVPVKIYLPAESEASPLVLFSHGLGGSREGNPYLGNHWAAHGYVVVFLQHAGSDRGVWESVKMAERINALKEAANVRSAIARYEDVPFVIDQLEAWNTEEGHALEGRLDLERIGMSGHSFGAHTTQAVMGQKFPVDRSFQEPRLQAFLAFSPSTSKQMSPEESFGEVEAPVLLMTGTKDGSPLEPEMNPETRTRVYGGLSPGNKFQLVLEDAEHFAFSEGGDGFRDRKRIDHHHPAILKISTLFWNAYLKGEESARSLLQSEKLREKVGLVEADVWEWK
ncbi:MAG: acetylhydrolase [Verrucomicrobiota bacterium]